MLAISQMGSDQPLPNAPFAKFDLVAASQQNYATMNNKLRNLLFGGSIPPELPNNETQFTFFFVFDGLRSKTCVTKYN
jgi:hypothetical protein